MTNEMNIARIIIIIAIIAIISILVISMGGFIKIGETDLEVSYGVAIRLLNEGLVEQIAHLHDGSVQMKLDNGQIISTTEPNGSDIFDEIQKCGAPCEDVIVTME